MAAQPNILFITTDHQRYDCVGANGNPHIRTPALDRLAAQGVSLERLYVQNPVCMPSRASIWTGRYPQNHRVTCNGIALRASEITMAHAFAAAGYRTANVGKLHFLPHKGRDHTRNDEIYAGYGYQTNLLSEEPGCYPDAYIRWVERTAPQHLDAVRVPLPGSPEPRGHFDEWTFQAPEEYSHPAWVARQTAEFLRAYDGDAPFFLSAGFYAPHPPLNPPAQYVDLYDEDALPLPRIHPSEAARSRWRDVTPAQWRRLKAFFYAMCSHVDDCVGRILAALEESGRAADTIVVFTSDHGDALGNHGEISKGPSNYEEIVRVPCLVRAPGRLPAGRRVGALVESIDLFPTLGGLCGVAMPEGVKGRDCGALLRGDTEAGRDDILIEYKDPRRGFSLKTLRTADFKYFRYGDGHERLYTLHGPDAEVFDLAADPAYRDILAALRRRLLDRLLAAEDDLPPRTADY